MKKVSIKDIAQKAEVSTATVSLVLNGKEKEGRVGKEVTERVRRIAQELNYQPNVLARSLQSGRSFVIGLIVADISNPFFSSLAYYVQDQLERSGYTAMIMNTNESDQHLEKNIKMLKNHQVDGFVIVPTENGENAIRELVEAKRPVVLLDRYYPSLQTYSVMVDSYQACFQATRLLIDKGCKRIAIIIYNNIQTHTTERKYGYTDAMKQAGIYDEELICSVNFHNLVENISETMERLIREKVDGILFGTNTISLLGIQELLNRKIKIPKQIRVVCFDKSEAYEFMQYPVPYVQQPVEIMGRKAADLLLEQLEKKEALSQVCKYPAYLVRRD